MIGEHNFKQFQSDSLSVDDAGSRLPDQPARWVKLSNWNVEDAAAMPRVGTSLAPVEEPFEIYFGYNGQFAHQLFISESSDWLPVTNLNQISVRARVGTTRRVHYSYVQ